MTRPRATAQHQLRFTTSDAGAAGIEFALIIPVLLVGLFLTLEFGRLMYSKVEFEYAVFSATRYNMVSKNVDTAKVQTALAGNLILLNPAKLSPVTYAVTANADKTKTATLTAAYKVDSLLPMTSMSSITLSRTVTFIIAN